LPKAEKIRVLSAHFQNARSKDRPAFRDRALLGATRKVIE